MVIQGIKMERKKRKTTNSNIIKNKSKVYTSKSLILTLFFINTFFIIFSFFSNTGFLGNFIKSIFVYLFSNTYYVFLIFMEIIYFLLLIKKINKENREKFVMFIILFINYLAIVDIASNSSMNISVKLAVANSLSNLGTGSGYIGAYLGYFYTITVGSIGLYVFTFVILLFLILSFLDITFTDFLKIIRDLVLKIFKKITDYKEKRKEEKLKENKENKENTKNEENKDLDFDKDKNFEQIEVNDEIIIDDYKDKSNEDKDNKNKESILDSFDLFPENNINIEEDKKSKDVKTFKSKDVKNYQIPSLNLLNESKLNETESENTLKQRAKKIETTLKSFSVNAKVVKINKGPTVTCFELQPDLGVKVNKIVNLADDLSLALASSDIRIEAPIPGKSVIGIEVANTLKESVSLREILSSREYQNSTSKMPMALGKTISGEVIVSSIDKMPHMLIAGATGSGKSVCINTIIMSILFKSSPDDVKMILIDPKVVELSVYNKIPHLAIPVVTDSKKASAALNWAVREMERRYSLFSDNQVRDIKGYNEKQKINDLEKLPYLVIIIDELSDLMMVSANEVESYICRLAQMARACGIHLIVATQRPSVDVITGTIKANIPSRISFQVSSQIDSRTILDTSGAETLLGKGDMLFSPSGSSKPIRIQGCFVSDLEVEKVVNSIKDKSQQVIYDEKIINDIEKESLKDNNENEDVDELFYDAVKIILDENSASISLLQRKMKIGYARAGRIIDEMENRSIIGKQEGSKPRKILVGYEYLNTVKGGNDEYSQ